LSVQNKGDAGGWLLPHGSLADAASGPVTRSLNLLFAIASGLAVANVYFAQPLLESMAYDLGVAESTIGVVVAVTQIGYALGLIFIVPLGDLVSRRRLVVSQVLVSSMALVVVSQASSMVVLLGGMVVVGLAAVVVQVLVAFAAALATAADRGRSVGTVTSGVVLGILLARFVAGTLADLGGWRAVYLTSGGLALAMAGVLYRVLPAPQAPVVRGSYVKLLRSVYSLFASEPLLRVRAGLALLIFASFSVLWTSMVLPLSAAPQSLSQTQVGAFGLAGVAGALAASRAGKWADRGHGQRTTGVALSLLLLSWVPTAFLQESLLALVAGVVLLDLAVQAVHVTSQTMILAARPDAQSRVVAGYMVFYSIGSALGAITATSIYAAAGWAPVCMLGALFSGLALLLWALTRHVVTSPRTRS
jgi:predicted MFS family arabinose efflux permease